MGEFSDISYSWATYSEAGQMAQINKHGLPRTIPADVKREIRRRCGFGCVRCGLIFYEYEHFAPDFVDAKRHNPEGMTLLCSQCNQKRRRGVLSVEAVSRANKNPISIANGQAQEWLDISHDYLEVEIGGSKYIDCKSLINIKGQSVFSVTPPSEEGAPYSVSALFADDTGAITLKIDNNQMSVGADNWDVEWKGKTLTIRKSPRNISLVMTLYPPRRIVIEKLEMELDGVKISTDSQFTNLMVSGCLMKMQKGTFRGEGAGISVP